MKNIEKRTVILALAMDMESEVSNTSKSKRGTFLKGCGILVLIVTFILSLFSSIGLFVHLNPTCPAESRQQCLSFCGDPLEAAMAGRGNACDANDRERCKICCVESCDL